MKLLKRGASWKSTQITVWISMDFDFDRLKKVLEHGIALITKFKIRLPQYDKLHKITSPTNNLFKGIPAQSPHLTNSWSNSVDHTKENSNFSHLGDLTSGQQWHYLKRRCHISSTCMIHITQSLPRNIVPVADLTRPKHQISRMEQMPRARIRFKETEEKT